MADIKIKVYNPRKGQTLSSRINVWWSMVVWNVLDFIDFIMNHDQEESEEFRNKLRNMWKR